MLALHHWPCPVPQTNMQIACEAEITDCQPLPDGRFYLEVLGRRRFRPAQTWEQASGAAGQSPSLLVRAFTPPDWPGSDQPSGCLPAPAAIPGRPAPAPPPPLQDGYRVARPEYVTDDDPAADTPASTALQQEAAEVEALADSWVDRLRTLAQASSSCL